MDKNSEPDGHFTLKRYKTTQDSSISIPHHAKYTVAWVCALYIELDAARAMLDEIHDPLPQTPHDTNSYVLGSIYGHDIVIACLPTEQYGTINTAMVVTNMKRTYTSIRLALMVGIGGGVPSKNDIRLGDIVVGTRVMQYDLGKIMADGKFERTSVAHTLGTLLGTALTSLRAKHDEDHSRILSILQERLKRIPQYARPEAPDRLFCAAYEHQASNCDECDQFQLIERSKRVPDTLRIHYGAIASSNQVMKHATTRDNLAQELDVICFEMETAGLMDSLPCLPIRGVCDYSDSHKSKEWQRYAATTAAAYARNLIEELRFTEQKPIFVAEKSLDMDQFRLCIRWILFAERPLSAHEFYHALWSGLSARGLVDEEIPIGQTMHTITVFVISSSKVFAEVTTFGSPVVQFIHESVRDFLIKDGGLFEHLPGAESDWESSSHDILRKCCDSYLRQPTIRETFRRLHSAETDIVARETELSTRGRFPFFQYAVECILYHANAAAKSIPQRTTLLQFPRLEWIAMNDYLKQTYPPYSQNASLFYILGDRGLSNLVRTMMREDPQVHVRGEDFEYPIFAAIGSNHKPTVAAFLGLSSIIENGVDITEELDSATRKPFTKHYKNRTPLSWAAQEGYFGIVRRLCSERKFLINLTDGDNMTPIRRAVENGQGEMALLLVDNGADIGSGFTSQEEFFRLVVKQGCAVVAKRFIDFEIDADTRDGRGCTVLHVAVKEEQDYGPITRMLIENGANINAQNKDGDTPLHIALYGDHDGITTFIIDHGADLNIQNKNGLTPLHISSEINNETMGRLIVRKGANLNIQDTHGRTPLHIALDPDYEPMSSFIITNEVYINILGNNGMAPFHTALRRDFEAIAWLIIATGANMHIQDEHGRTPLHAALQKSDETIAILVLAKTSDVNVQNDSGQTPLHVALERGYKTIATLIIDKGSDVNIQDSSGQTPLHIALHKNYDAISRLILDKLANINIQDNSGQTPLHVALQRDCEAIARSIIDKGADVNIQNCSGQTSLHIALYRDYEAISVLIIDKATNVTIQDSHGLTPLQIASRRSYRTIVNLLIHKGGKPDIPGEIAKNRI